MMQVRSWFVVAAALGLGASCGPTKAQATVNTQNDDSSGQSVDRVQTDATNVALYKSDSCSSELVAFIGEKSDCDEMARNISARVWGVQVNGKCIDIADQDFKPACKAFQAANDDRATVLWHSDSCSQEAIAYVNDKTDCANIGISTQVWGVSQNGACTDIADMSFSSACETYKRSQGNVQLYHSDSCSSEFITNVGEKTDCDEVATRVKGQVWGMKVNGRCYDVTDADFKVACKAFQGAEVQGSTLLWRSDSCRDNLLAVVNEKTVCENIGLSGRVWGISRSEACTDIADMGFVDACNNFKGKGSGGGGIGLYHSDNCSNELLTSISEKTACDSLSNISSSVWGVKVGATCYDIRDTNAVTACKAFQASTDPEATALYHSDVCGPGELLAFVNKKTECSTMNITTSVWGIKNKSGCSDIADMSFTQACIAFQGGSTGGNTQVSFYRSDSCSNEYVGDVNDKTQCDALGSIGQQSVWGLRSDEACYDIVDTSYTDACYSFAAGVQSAAVVLYRSDSCSGPLVATVGAKTNCSDLALHARSAVWGIWMNGRCEDIADTDAASACNRFKPNR